MTFLSRLSALHMSDSTDLSYSQALPGGGRARFRLALSNSARTSSVPLPPECRLAMSGAHPRTVETWEQCFRTNTSRNSQARLIRVKRQT